MQKPTLLSSTWLCAMKSKVHPGCTPNRVLFPPGILEKIRNCIIINRFPRNSTRKDATPSSDLRGQNSVSCRSMLPAKSSKSHIFYARNQLFFSFMVMHLSRIRFLVLSTTGIGTLLFIEHCTISSVHTANSWFLYRFDAI